MTETNARSGEPETEDAREHIERTTAEDARAHAKLRDAIVYPPEGLQVCGQPNCAYFDAKARSMRDYRVRFLYDEYRQACDREGLVALRPSSFATRLAKWRRDEAVGKAPAWFPGELMQTYWTILCVDAPGLPPQLPMFVAYLPSSGLSYLRVCASRSFMDWMLCCAAAYRYMGGVPHVTEYHRNGDRPDRRAGESQRATLRAFADHYRTVLLQPRPKGEREPSDRLKPLVLKRYTAAGRYVRSRLAIDPGMTAEDVDERVRALADEFNRAHEGTGPSIMELFQQQEAPQLLTLPENDYDMAVWARRHANSSYHFEQDFVRYSVPWRYAGDPVHVRADGKTVQVYSMGELIAAHDVPSNPEGKVVTDPAHRPPQHRSFADRLEDRFMALALEHGPATGAVMREIVLACKRDDGCWRPCKDLLDLARTPSGIRLEDACAQVLEREMPLATESVAQIMRENTR